MGGWWSRLRGCSRAEAVSACVVLGVLVMFALSMAEVVRLQTMPDERLQTRIASREARATTPGIRGDILDRRGRVLATTRFAWRVFIDPVQLPEEPHEVIGRLAELLQEDASAVGARVVGALALNAEREREAAAGRPAVAEPDAGASRWRRAWTALAEAWGSDRTEAADEAQRVRLQRYLRVGPVLTDAQAAAVRSERLPGVHLERVPVRESPGGLLAANIVGKFSTDAEGRLGVERSNHETLEASPAVARYARDARGRALWIEAGDWEPIRRGVPLALSIDLELQRIAIEELRRGVERAEAQGGRIILMDPYTGEILAMADVRREAQGVVPIPWVSRELARADEPEFPDFNTSRAPRLLVVPEDERAKLHPALAINRCVEAIYEPGSTFKPFMWASALAAGVVTPEEIIDTEGGRFRTFYGRYLEDVVKRDRQSWTDVLVNSSNIGMVKVLERMEPRQVHGSIEAFGFGRRTGIPLPGEPRGMVTPLRSWSRFTHTSVAFGHEVAVTPLQMVRGFSAFARPGELAGTLPTVRLSASSEADADIAERAVPAWAAVLARTPMETVVDSMRQREATKRRREGLPAEPEARYRLFGKSGTAKVAVGDPPEGMRRPRGVPAYLPRQYHSSFIAAGPTEAPRLVALVIIDDPAPELVRRREAFGSHVAGPVVGRVMERGLLYLGVPPSPSRTPGDDAPAPRVAGGGRTNQP
ncbi:MAG: penicillin-binding protein 2 [Phycisphaerales bacterium]|nr:MAG: penicillin-binding protein 2 [Phycisphaerales bacterium]